MAYRSWPNYLKHRRGVEERRYENANIWQRSLEQAQDVNFSPRFASNPPKHRFDLIISAVLPQRSKKDNATM